MGPVSIFAKAEIDDVFLANLEIVGNLLAASGFAPAAFVESELGSNELAVILEEPADAVVRSATLFIRGESHDDVTIGLEALLFELDQVGDPDSRLSLVVAGAAAVKEAIALDELKGVHAPVFALGFDDINVGEKQNRVEGSRAVITNDEIRLLGIRAPNEDIGFGEARGAQTSRSRLGNGSGGAGGETGLDFDKFFVNVAGEFSFYVGPRGLGADGRGAE